MTRGKMSLVDKEVQSLLEKGAIKEIQSEEGKFFSSIFLVEKKDSGQRPVINLKRLNSYIPYNHFKMEGLYLLKDLLLEGDFMCKVDLKDAYFVVPLHCSSQEFVCFNWREKLYQFVCLCFGLAPAPLVFTKLMKIPI